MLGAAAMAVSTGALAQSSMSMATVPNFYAGVDVGQTDVADEDDIGFRLFGGYQFHRNIAVELGYGLLFDKDDVEVTSLEATAVGIWPIANQFSVLAKLGLANVEVDSPFGSDDSTELTYGIGVQFDISRNLAARAMWQRYETDEELDYLHIGVMWRF
jgi:OOP family OmpA-OmpF porin